MKRAKTNSLLCRPAASHFAPTDKEASGAITLETDELQAMYLADFEALYHEEGAERLGVSRPTFAKLLKRARRKMVEMVLLGRSLNVAAGQQDFVVVFPTDDRATIHPYFLVARYFAFAQVKNGTIESIRFVDNPIHLKLQEEGVTITDDDSAKGMAAGRLIPPLLQGAQMLVVRTLGDGMRRNIEGMGIAVESVTHDHIDRAIQSVTAARFSDN